MSKSSILEKISTFYTFKLSDCKCSKTEADECEWEFLRVKVGVDDVDDVDDVDECISQFVVHQLSHHLSITLQSQVLLHEFENLRI